MLATSINIVLIEVDTDPLLLEHAADVHEEAAVEVILVQKQSLHGVAGGGVVALGVTHCQHQQQQLIDKQRRCSVSNEVLERSKIGLQFFSLISLYLIH